MSPTAALAPCGQRGVVADRGRKDGRMADVKASRSSYRSLRKANIRLDRAIA
jgi:hypothetical protein